MIELAPVQFDPGSIQQKLGSADYARIARVLSQAVSVPSLRPLKFGILSSCSMQFAQSALLVEGARRKLHLTTYYGPFGQFEQQVANPGSQLYAFQPDALLLFMRPEDLNPDLSYRYYANANGEAALLDVVARLVSCAEAFRRQSSGPLLVANFAMPDFAPLGPFDANAADSLTYAVAKANRELRDRISQIPGAVIWDYAALVREAGSSNWTDRRMWVIARTPVAADKQPVLARHLVRTLAGMTFTPAKCLVLDLDNTVWGGVIGDDGMEGIQLGDDYPGSVFKSFQRAALGLADRGILLAVVSKNDPEVVEQALRDHPEMLIRPENISAMRVNWQPKSDNLRAIAAELNLGLDALVHFDDNPMERAEIAANAPEVKLVDVPADPLGYERALYECGYFDTVTISQEDRQRVQMYRSERARDEVRATAHSVEDFLAGLEMTADVAFVDDANLGRVSQLIGKTNQFNLTTRRHSQAEVSRMARDDSHEVIYLRLADRFGDLGLIAVGILAIDGKDAVIDTLVMSCRAMGRLVENAFVHELAQVARARGCERLFGDYLPTPRNGIVAQLFSSLGFAHVTSLEGDGERYVLELNDSTLQWPAVIRRNAPTPEGNR